CRRGTRASALYEPRPCYDETKDPVVFCPTRLLSPSRRWLPIILGPLPCAFLTSRRVRTRRFPERAEAWPGGSKGRSIFHQETKCRRRRVRIDPRGQPWHQ